MNTPKKVNKIKVLAADVDGTITDADKKLDVTAIQKIRELENVGIRVILITGHVFPVVSSLSNYIGTSGPVVAEGGAVVGLPWKLTFTLGEKVPEQSISLMREMGFTEAGSNEYRHVDLAFHRNGVTLEVEAIEKTLQKHKVYVEVRDSGYAVHLTPEGVNKGKGLTKAVEWLGYSLEETAVIGDSTFDAPMYQVAGFSGISKQGPESLRQLSTVLVNGTHAEAFVEFANLFIERKEDAAT